MTFSRLSVFKLFGPYIYLVRMMFLAMLVLSVSRLVLVLLNYHRVEDTGSLLTLFMQGVRVDFILVCIWVVLPILFVPIFARQRFHNFWFKYTFWWAYLGLFLILFLELATPSFLMQFDTRPNRIFIEYLKYPTEVFLTLWHGFKWSFVGGITLTMLLGIAFYYMLSGAKSKPLLWSSQKSLIVWPFVIAVLFIGIRSTTHHRPANPAMFAITGDSMVNSLVINSGYSLLYAIYSMRHEARSSEIYGELSISEMLRYSLDWPWLKQYSFENPQYPTVHFQGASIKREKPLNLVIILQESMGATFVKSLGGRAVTPELEKLASDGIWFERLYATGTRSVRGIEAVIAGFLPTPAQSVVKLSKSQNHFSTLASVLKDKGYKTQFIYGGEAHFDNMRGFFTNNGVEDIVDIEKIVNPKFVGSWGASDEDVFDTAEQQLESLHNAGVPFFSLIFTSSNHEPFQFPDNRVALFEQPKNTVNNAVKYADWAMGRFFDHAKKSAYWKDTLFLVVADHDNRVYGGNLIPVENFRIPGLILGADIKPQRISELASQIDLAPTLLSLMGISSCHPMVGRDFASDSTSSGRAFLQFQDYFVLMEPEKLTVLKPDGKALSGTYDENRKLLLMAGNATDRDYKRTLAHVQLPSYLYRNEKYIDDKKCSALIR